MASIRGSIELRSPSCARASMAAILTVGSSSLSSGMIRAEASRSQDRPRDVIASTLFVRSPALIAAIAALVLAIAALVLV
ncbi:MAG: hypothetical protein IPO77_14990 [Acidobacteria bacterium]|nr:hypothetical protein [Acidobacteriota bacterium]